MGSIGRREWGRRVGLADWSGSRTRSPSLSLFLSFFLSFTLPLLVLSFLLHSFFTLLCSSHATLVENAILIDDTILLNFLKNFNESSFRVFGHWRTERGVGI